MVDRDTPRAVKLLDQKHSHHRVWQRQVRQPQAFVRRLLESGIQPIGAADHDGHVIARQLPCLETLGQRHRANSGTALVKGHHTAIFCDGAFDAHPFSSQQGVECFGGARLGFDSLEFNPQLGRKALGVVVVGRLRPVGHLLPDGYYRQSHRLLGAVFRAAGLAAVFAAVFAATFRAASFLATGTSTTGVLTNRDAGFAAGLLTGFKSGPPTVFFAGALLVLAGRTTGSSAGAASLRLAVQSLVLPSLPM